MFVIYCMAIVVNSMFYLQKFTPKDLLNFAVQISAGLEYLESQKFVHRDIALRNCL